MKESPLFAKTYTFMKWIIPLSLKFPRAERFVLAQAIQQASLNLHESLLAAVRWPEKTPHLIQADVELDKLRTYLRLSQDLHYISLGQHKHGAEMLKEIGRMLGAWQRQLK